VSAKNKLEQDMKTRNEPASRNMNVKKNVTLRVFGVGGAGCNAVEHMMKSGLEGVSFGAVNTDLQALLNMSVHWVLPLGPMLTRGLGTGGDPELGRAAAEEDAEQLRELCADAGVVVIVAGLGGGAGTGASPVLARAAREAGALVLAMVTLPFDCEGARRQAQAAAGLEQLKEVADAVICLPNQRMLKVIDESTSLIETFKITNEFLAEGMRGIHRLLSRTGIINVDFGDLCAVVRGRHAESSLATAEARGEHRCREVIEKLMSSPLLEGGAVLNEADAVLVSLVGGPNLTMAEVNRIMTQINRACENAQVIMGATIEEQFDDRLEVTLIATRRGQTETPRTPMTASQAPSLTPSDVRSTEASERTAAEEPSDFDSQFFQETPSVRPPSRFVPPPPDLSPDKRQQILAQKQGGKAYRKSGSKMRQGMLPLDIVSKGRFEKSEPTIYHGEDLDVPTYIRRGVPLN
jgi:cell division protein FtsZ